ncbi:MAG: OmpA family protein [Bryobacteraceae bacterium]
MNAGPLLAAIAALILGFLCVRHHAPAIQSDLLVKSQQALQAAGISPLGLSFDGRDAVLRGHGGSAAVSTRAREVVEGVWGVRRPVRVELVSATAPPPPKTEEIQRQLTELIRLKNVEFETASANITVEGRAILDEVAGVLRGAPHLQVNIEGHTDSRGVPAANRKLSQDRADSVREYLAGKGIAADRMRAEGFGSDRPVAFNDSVAGRKANRRIEFVVREQ